MFLNLIASGQGSNGDREDCFFREAPGIFEGEVKVGLRGDLGCMRASLGAGAAETTEVYACVGDVDFREIMSPLDRILACREEIYENEIIGGMNDIVVYADLITNAKKTDDTARQ